MPILSYELGHRSKVNSKSTTGARDGHVAAIIKHDTESVSRTGLFRACRQLIGAVPGLVACGYL